MIEPGRIGSARATIRLWNDDLETLPSQSVTLRLTAPTAGSKPVTRTAVRQPDAAWIVDEIQLPESATGPSKSTPFSEQANGFNCPHRS